VKRIKEMRRREEEKGKGEGKEASERYTIPFFLQLPSLQMKTKF